MSVGRWWDVLLLGGGLCGPGGFCGFALLAFFALTGEGFSGGLAFVDVGLVESAFVGDLLGEVSGRGCDSGGAS